MRNKLLALSGLLLFSIMSIAQNTINFSVFSEDGYAFYVFVNGVKQNTTAETNVRLTNQSPSFSLRIEFENKIYSPIKKNIFLEAGREHTGRIIRDKKNQLKLGYFGSLPLNEVQSSTGNESYHVAEDAPAETSSINSSTSYSTAEVDPGFRVMTPVEVHTASVNPVRYAMSEGSFLKMKESIEAKSFTDTKMTVAQVVIQTNYLTVNQIKIIAGLFNMDEDRLAYAKYAYDHCVDKANYYLVGDAFKFSFTMDELNAFLKH